MTSGGPPPARILSRREFGGAVLAVTAAACQRRESAPTTAPSASAAAPASPLTPPAPPPRQPALLRAWPEFAAHVSWLPIATLPTPVTRAARLGSVLGLDRLFVKRDDLSGDAYGGGKTRKLALLLGHAQAAGARRIVTFGAIGSNQAVATALYGAANGFSVELVLAPGAADERAKRNLLAARRAGATFRLAESGVAGAEAAARTEASRGGPHVIAAGGSTPLGNLAFVDAGLELAEQITAGLLAEPARIYVAMGTMGSAVGLSIGLALAGSSSEVVAVRTSSEATSSAARFAAMTAETLSAMRRWVPSLPQVQPRTRLLGTQLGGGYAIPTADGLRAVALADQHEGWVLEPTYTGKTLAALLAERDQMRDASVLFWASHNSRNLFTDGVTATDFPRALRRFVE